MVGRAHVARLLEGSYYGIGRGMTEIASVDSSYSDPEYEFWSCTLLRYVRTSRSTIKLLNAVHRKQLNLSVADQTGTIFSHHCKDLMKLKAGRLLYQYNYRRYQLPIPPLWFERCLTIRVTLSLWSTSMHSEPNLGQRRANIIRGHKGDYNYNWRHFHTYLHIKYQLSKTTFFC